MAIAELVDHSPQQPDAAAPITTASNVILIDNYDSFTWNVYQYLILEGAKVTVYRNDEISLEELKVAQPTQLVVSPGPGHPSSDSGVSQDAIRYFAGKIPVLGVCMGQQCIFAVFGGTVSQTGEILHGKTSPLRHDGRGVYEGLAQDLPVTRYHSLAGTHPSLPDSLEVTSWIASGPDGGKGVIMGVRHKEFVVEGVQFHPESILTAEGRVMLKNFLHMRGGTWAENAKLQAVSHSAAAPVINGHDKQSSILERIYAKRREAVAAQMLVPSQRPQDFQAALDMDLAPPLIDFVQRLKQTPFKLSLMAEIKRASPSKGIISLDVCAPAQARTYALAGASVISVLTEPDWFKGSIDDLRLVRNALSSMEQRPAVLRKEFIFNEYQILEARLAGADTFLLIVKMLDTATLTKLYKYGQGLGMEALVEVNNIEEMKIAVELGSKVIGVNNRNLTTFDVDMETTSRLMSMVPEGTILCALSGITGPQDVAPYQQVGVGAVLVGEALMRAKDTAKFITELLGGSTKQRGLRQPLVKICGTRTVEAAEAAIAAGADMIGMILVPGRKRTVSFETARAISDVVHTKKKASQKSTTQVIQPDITARDEAASAETNLQSADRTLLVGVFRNQPLEYILEQQKLLDLDVVQLHGEEPIKWATVIPVPVIHVFKPGHPDLAIQGYHAAALLDSGDGGTGERLDITEVKNVLAANKTMKVILAGGLTPQNIKQAISYLGADRRGILGLDVASGVESNGEQDVEKIRAFIHTAKSCSL